MITADSLDRFLAPQERAWARVTSELSDGQKASHWMWYVFPQLRGLGSSEQATFFGLHDLAEARAYLAHETLSARLEEAVSLMLRHQGKTPESILGDIDALKLRSSATLFEAAANETRAKPFVQVIDAFFGGRRCPLTLALLSGPA